MRDGRCCWVLARSIAESPHWLSEHASSRSHSAWLNCRTSTAYAHCKERSVDIHGGSMRAPTSRLQPAAHDMRIGCNAKCMQASSPHGMHCAAAAHPG
jgi:hypothetical protein